MIWLVCLAGVVWQVSFGRCSLSVVVAPGQRPPSDAPQARSCNAGCLPPLSGNRMVRVLENPDGCSPPRRRMAAKVSPVAVALFRTTTWAQHAAATRASAFSQQTPSIQAAVAQPSIGQISLQLGAAGRPTLQFQDSLPLVRFQVQENFESNLSIIGRRPEGMWLGQLGQLGQPG